MKKYDLKFENNRNGDLSISKVNSPFFIFSCGRSGSSLLSRMLNSHYRLAVPYESHLFNTFYPWLKYYGDLEDRRNQMRMVNDILSTDVLNDFSPRLKPRQVIGLIKKNDFGGIVEAVLSCWAETQQKSRWGEKTPKHINFWRQILRYFPDAKFLHIVRDGRDVALSWIRARFGPKTVYAAARAWARYLDKIEELKSVDDSLIYEVKYEDLLENPEDVLRKTCNFLKEDYSPKMVEFYKDKTPYKSDKVNIKNLNMPLLKNNKEKWKLEMTRNDLRIFEAIAKTHLQRYGYQLVLEESFLSKKEKIYHQFIEHPPRKFLAMSANRKGHKDAYIRFKIWLRLVLFYRFIHK